MYHLTSPNPSLTTASNMSNMRRTFIPVLLSLFLREAVSSNALAAGEISMGTTILAVRFKGGIVVGADTRTSVSGYVSNRYAAKLTFVLDRQIDSYVAPAVRTYHDREHEGQTNNLLENRSVEQHDDAENEQHAQANADNTNFTLTKLPLPEASTCVICRSGSAADTQHLASIVRSELVTRQILYRVRGTVTHVASLLRNLLSNDSALSASLICAGYDHELDRGVIYSINPGGTVFEERIWAAGGSGSIYILGYLDSHLPKGPDGNIDCLIETEEEALDIVCSAIGLAMDRDGSSGGFIRMYVIDRFGRRFVSRLPDAPKNDRGQDAANKVLKSLSHFAEATQKISNGISD